MSARWNKSAAVFPADYRDMVKRYQEMDSHPTIFLMVPPPLYRDQRYNMNQTVINTVFPGSGPAGIRSIAHSLGISMPHVVDVYSMFQQHCPVLGGTPGHAPNASDVMCDWIGALMALLDGYATENLWLMLLLLRNDCQLSVKVLCGCCF
eukprot:SAG31_NODE_4629_length_3085_cov_2.778299_3_plen_150_part_00